MTATVTAGAAAVPRPFRCHPSHSHGATETCYTNHGCRCQWCLEGHSTRRQNYALSRSGMRVAGCARCGIYAPTRDEWCVDCLDVETGSSE